MAELRISRSPISSVFFAPRKFNHRRDADFSRVVLDFTFNDPGADDVQYGIGQLRSHEPECIEQIEKSFFGGQPADVHKAWRVVSTAFFVVGEHPRRIVIARQGSGLATIKNLGGVDAVAFYILLAPDAVTEKPVQVTEKIRLAASLSGFSSDQMLWNPPTPRACDAATYR